jgi:NADH-quinone oxidoreductase subunit M
VILSLVIFIPTVAGFLILLVPRRMEILQRSIALAGAAVSFALSIVVFANFRGGIALFQFEESWIWIQLLGASYHIGIDGISLFLVLLTTFLSMLCVISSWGSVKERIKEYHFFLLLLETGMVGVFCAMDFFLFYVFWELMLVPMYFLIGIWGGPRRVYAAVKFFIYTMAGSVLMLVGILYLYFHTSDPLTGQRTFDIVTISQQCHFPLSVQTWLFLAFGIAFAIKVPMFPFHTWLPDAHVEAPTAGSVILAGVLLKMGTYGFLRFCLPMFPQATIEFVPVISILALIGILYGALVSMVQKDMKRLVAYSSVAHLGFVMLGMFSLNLQGLAGSLLQQINHGLSTGALFLLVGVLYDRKHTRMIEDYGGIAKVMPLYASLFMLVTLSSIGVPGFNGFVGEFLILLGTFQSNVTYGVLGTVGVILAAVYLLWMYQRVFYGKIVHADNEKLRDCTAREAFVLIALIVFIILIGVYPDPFLSRMEPSLKAVLDQVTASAAAVPAVP